MPADRRIDLRLAIRILVQYKLQDMEEFKRKYAVNISSGGMFILCADPCPINTTLYFQFKLQDGEKIIEGLGQVVHVNPPEHEYTGMGIEFLHLDAASKITIDEIVKHRVEDNCTPKD